MGYSHFNSHAFHGKGKAIILDGPRKANVKIDGKPATFHGYDKGRAVYVVYGRTGPGRVEINGETIEFSGNGIQRQGRVVGNSSGGSTNHRQNLERIVANGGGKAEVKAYLDKNGISARDVAVPVAAGTAVAAGREGGVPAGLGNFVPDSVKRKAWEMVSPGNTPADIASAVKAQGLSSTISGMASGAPAASLAYTPAGIGANPATAYIPSNLPVGAAPSAAPAGQAATAAMGFTPWALALPAFGMYSRMGSKREDARTLGRAAKASWEGDRGSYTDSKGRDFQYLARPRLENYQQDTLRQLNGPLLESVLPESLVRGARSGRNTIYEFTGDPSDNQLDAYQAWLKTMPRFNQSDYEQEQAALWLKNNPYDAFEKKYGQNNTATSTQSSRPSSGSNIGGLQSMTANRGAGKMDYGSWLSSQGYDKKNKMYYTDPSYKKKYQSYLG